MPEYLGTCVHDKRNGETSRPSKVVVMKGWDHNDQGQAIIRVISLEAFRV